MARLVALLRGVNVGGHRKLAMARLRELAEGLGCSDVATYVQSGNLVLTAPVGSAGSADQLAARLSDAIAAAFGFPVEVIVRSGDELAAVVAADPLRGVATDPARHHVLFLGDAPDPAVVAGLEREAFAPDAFVLHGRELHLWTPGGMHASRLARSLTDKRLGVPATARNWRTVERLVAMARETG